ncbi:hypothetical protein BH11ACT3_BH11ACT3_19780 [soil metagenome]
MSENPRFDDASRSMRVLGAPLDDVHFTWPACEVCAEPMDFHSIHEEPVWYCSECGTV